MERRLQLLGRTASCHKQIECELALALLNTIPWLIICSRLSLMCCVIFFACLRKGTCPYHERKSHVILDG